MKKVSFIILIAAFVLALSIRAQDLTNALPRTDIEAFEAQTNTVIIKASSLINSINMGSGSISVRCKESTNVGTGQKEYGLMLEFTGNNEERVRAVVDYSELPSLLDGIDYLDKVTSDVTTLASFDASYTTKSGFRMIAFSSRRQGNVQMFIKFEGFERIPLTSDQISQFRDLIASAKSTLDALQAGK